MTYGLQIRSGNGSIEFDTTVSTYRSVLSVLVSFLNEARGTKTFQVPGCNASNSICFLLPIDNNTSSDFVTNFQLECEIGDGVAYVRNFLAGWPVNDSYSQATMRLIVMRWA